MGKPAPICEKCKTKVTARGKQGLTCVGCATSIHFECMSITETRKKAYLTNKECYTCGTCKSKHRLSLSIVADTSVVGESVGGQSATKLPSTTSAANNKTVNTCTCKHDSTNDNQIANLTAVVSSLQSVVQSLQQALTGALKEIASLKQDNKTRVNRPTNTSKNDPTSTTASKRDFTVNGIPKDLATDPTAVVTNILKTLDNNFTLHPNTKITPLPTKSQEEQTSTIIISTEVTSENCKLLDRNVRKKFEPVDFNLVSDKPIYINESHPKRLYQLYKSATKLFDKGFKYVWIQRGRVLARKTDGEKITQIRDLNHIEELLGLTTSNENEPSPN